MEIQLTIAFDISTLIRILRVISSSKTMNECVFKSVWHGCEGQVCVCGGCMYVSVQENVCNNSKKTLKKPLFDFKKRKKRKNLRTISQATQSLNL